MMSILMRIEESLNMCVKDLVVDVKNTAIAWSTHILKIWIGGIYNIRCNVRVRQKANPDFHVSVGWATSSETAAAVAATDQTANRVMVTLKRLLKANIVVFNDIFCYLFLYEYRNIHSRIIDIKQTLSRIWETSQAHFRAVFPEWR
jgi:hypothetical protein